MLEQLPYPIAMEMLLTGDMMDAETAARWGLITKVVPQADLLSTAHAYAKRKMESKMGIETQSTNGQR